MSINITANSEESFNLIPHVLAMTQRPSRTKSNPNKNIQSVIPQTSVIPVVNPWLEPTASQINTDSWAMKQKINRRGPLGTPDNNVKSIQSGNTISAANGITASGNSNSIPAENPTTSTANPQVDSAPNDSVVGDALIGSGTDITGSSTVPVVTVAATPNVVIPSNSLENTLNNNPVIGYIIAAIIFVIISKALGGS